MTAGGTARDDPCNRRPPILPDAGIDSGSLGNSFPGCYGIWGRELRIGVTAR